MRLSPDGRQRVDQNMVCTRKRLCAQTAQSSGTQKELLGLGPGGPYGTCAQIGHLPSVGGKASPKGFLIGPRGLHDSNAVTWPRVHKPEP